MKTRVLLLIALLAVPLIAFAQDNEKPIPLNMDYSALDRERAPEPVRAACDIVIGEITDARANKDTIGASRGLAGGDPLLTTSEEMLNWVREGLMELKAFGYPVSQDSRSTGAVVIQPSLTKAYTWLAGGKIFSMVSFKVRFSKEGALVQEKVYRAHGDKLNGFNADSEKVTTLNYALNNILPALANDLQALCRGERVDAYTYAHPLPDTKELDVLGKNKGLQGR